MAASKSASLDNWRDFFRTANSDIFTIIEQAIMVAASDCPKDFRNRRDEIAEVLFSSKLVKCAGCDRVTLSVPAESVNGGPSCEVVDRCELEPGISKGSNMVSSSKDDHTEVDLNPGWNLSYGEVEALTDAIEEENQIYKEVMRIKEIFDNSREVSESTLYSELSRLQLMAISVETLKATEIGKSVNGLRKHLSKDVRQIARMLIEEWKNMVDEWVKAMEPVPASEATPESVKPSVLDEEVALHTPPLDLDFFNSMAMDFSDTAEFFNDIGDDGNPRRSEDCNKNHGRGRNFVNPTTATDKKGEDTKKPKEHGLLKEEGLNKKPSSAVRPSKPPVVSGSGRPLNPSADLKVNKPKSQQKSEQVNVAGRPPVSQQPKQRPSSELSAQAKLELTKRKLQESYQQAENAKRQRTIQVMELQDCPKQSLVHKNSHSRPGSNHNRQWANGRR